MTDFDPADYPTAPPGYYAAAVEQQRKVVRRLRRESNARLRGWRRIWATIVECVRWWR